MKLIQSDHTTIVIIVKHLHHRLKGTLESMSLHPHSTPLEVACFILSIEKHRFMRIPQIKLFGRGSLNL